MNFLYVLVCHSEIRTSLAAHASTLFVSIDSKIPCCFCGLERPTDNGDDVHFRALLGHSHETGTCVKKIQQLIDVLRIQCFMQQIDIKVLILHHDKMY